MIPLPLCSRVDTNFLPAILVSTVIWIESTLIMGDKMAKLVKLRFAEECFWSDSKWLWEWRVGPTMCVDDQVCPWGNRYLWMESMLHCCQLVEARETRCCFISAAQFLVHMTNFLKPSSYPALWSYPALHLTEVQPFCFFYTEEQQVSTTKGENT
jgi:hypothetical protein